MSERQAEDRNRDLDALRAAAAQESASARQQTSREIEARAGAGLKRDYWVEIVDSPFGKLSRRAVMATSFGTVLWCLVTSIAMLWRLSTPPGVQELPLNDARTVMTHVYANFNGNKSANFEPFVPREGETWRFTEAYTFTWQDQNGETQRAVIASYPAPETAFGDYVNYTRATSTDRHNEAVARSRETVIEARDKPQYASLWRGLRINNILLLISPGVQEADLQQLFSHVISITAAEQRDIIPTATP